MPTIRSDYNTYTLGSGLAAAGAASGVQIPGGEYMFAIDGTPGGTTGRLEVLLPDGRWTPVSVYSGSAVQSTTFPYSQTGVDLPAGQVRVNLSGGTPSGVNAYLIGLG